MDDEFLKNVYRVAKYYYDDIFFEKYSRIYKLTTENICGYLNQINMKEPEIIIMTGDIGYIIPMKIGKNRILNTGL